MQNWLGNTVEPGTFVEADLDWIIYTNQALYLR
jgi:hypothetical protein